MKLDAIAHAKPLIEIDEVCAAAQQHVLAVVDGRAIVVRQRWSDLVSGYDVARPPRKGRASNTVTR